MKKYLLDILCSISSIFGTRYGEIIRPRIDYTSPEAQAKVYVRYPKWMTWMKDTEQLYTSELGIIWRPSIQKHQGDWDVYLSRFLRRLHREKLEQIKYIEQAQQDPVLPTCHRCGEYVHEENV